MQGLQRAMFKQDCLVIVSGAWALVRGCTGGTDETSTWALEPVIEGLHLMGGGPYHSKSVDAHEQDLASDDVTGACQGSRCICAAWETGVSSKQTVLGGWAGQRAIVVRGCNMCRLQAAHG